MYPKLYTDKGITLYIYDHLVDFTYIDVLHRTVPSNFPKNTTITTS